MFCLGALIVKFKLLKKMGFVQGTTTVQPLPPPMIYGYNIKFVWKLWYLQGSPHFLLSARVRRLLSHAAGIRGS